MAETATWIPQIDFPFARVPESPHGMQGTPALNSDVTEK